MAFFSYWRMWFEKAMLEPDVNSRIVFLLHGLATFFGLLFLTIAFVFAGDKESYPYMLMALGGSGAAGAAGRWLTKKETTAKPTIDKNA